MPLVYSVLITVLYVSDLNESTGNLLGLVIQVLLMLASGGLVLLSISRPQVIKAAITPSCILLCTLLLNLHEAPPSVHLISVAVASMLIQVSLSFSHCLIESAKFRYG